MLVEGEKITTIGIGARRCRPTASSTRPASTCFPAASTCTRTSTCRSAAPRPPTTSSPGTIAAAHGGTTTIVDFAIQYRGQTLHHAWETWMKKAEGKAAIDYGFHMIVTELTDQVEQEMDALVRQGVTSFKLFMAYPGVFMLDDASIFKALLRTGKNGGTICMHAENGGVIDVLVQRALAEGQDRAEVPRADAAGARRGRGDASRDRAGRDRRRADLHRPPVGGRSAGDGDRGARPRPAGLRRDLPAVPVPVVRQLRGAGLRRREVRHEPAAPAEGDAGPALARPRVQRPAGDLDRPLPVLHEGAEDARRRTTSRRFRTARPASRRG